MRGHLWDWNMLDSCRLFLPHEAIITLVSVYTNAYLFCATISAGKWSRRYRSYRFRSVLSYLDIRFIHLFILSPTKQPWSSDVYCIYSEKHLGNFSSTHRLTAVLLIFSNFCVLWNSCRTITFVAYRFSFWKISFDLVRLASGLDRGIALLLSLQHGRKCTPIINVIYCKIFWGCVAFI